MKLSIVTKIVLLFTVVILLFMGVSYYQYRQMQRATRSLYDINTGYIPLSKIIAQIDTAQKNLQSDVDRVFDVEDVKARGILTRLALNYFPRVVNQHISTGIAQCDKLALITSASEHKRFYAETRDGLVDLRNLHEQYQQTASEVFNRLQSADADIKKEEAALRAVERKLGRAIKVLSLKMEKQLSANVAQLERTASQSSWAGILMAAAAFIIGALLTVVSAFLLKPLRRLTEAAEQIGQGEYRYSVSIARGDELGRLAEEFERMRTSLITRDKTLKEQAQKLEVSNKELNTLTLHYENILATLWLPVLVTDVHLRIKTVNPQAARLWGREPEDMLRCPVGELPVGDMFLGDVIPFERVIQEKKSNQRDTVDLTDLDGKLRRFAFSTVPLLDGDRVRGVLVLGEDITDALRVKDSMVHSERNAAIGKISSRIAHEIRNPLSSIALNTEMLQDELLEEKPDPAETRPLLESIMREVDRLHEITDRYLNITRSVPKRREQVNLNRLLSNVVDFYHLEMDRHKIRCDLKLPDKPVLADTDENQLVGVVHNLIKNAIEALPEGGRLTLDTFVIAGDTPEPRCRIVVEDNGPGVPVRYAEKIFEPFFSTKESGTGLGLALAQQVLGAMDGSIRLEVPEAGGARFVLEMPCASDKTPSGASTPLLLD